MVLMQSGLSNPDITSTNSEHVCNMDSHFKDYINLPSFCPCVFMIKTPLERTSYRTPPSKSKIPLFRPFFFMVLIQSGLRNPNCKGAFLEILQGAREDNRVGKVIL